MDRDTRETSSFKLADLPKHVEKFGFIMGMEKRSFKDQDPVNIKAAELVGKLHDSLEASGYKGHQLEVFLTRIVFCLFADDTGIFEPRDIFLDFLETRTKEDGSDTGPLLTQLFDVLDTPEDKRQTTLDEDLAHFPYVNGGLFSATIRTPAFNAEMRQRLLEAGQFNWSGISPAIFGSLFQSVMDKQERRAAGAHYTTEKNILKVIGPLFLDDLRAEFELLKARKTNRLKLLRDFHARLAELTFLDPACGCGNFLIITYRELRLLEIELLREIHRDDLSRMKGGATELPLQSLLKIDVDQFYGIEVSEFPSRIAETAMWMMDHIMNTQASLEFGAPFLRIPLRKSPAITHGDALELDWQNLLPAGRCSYVMGNPPFVGFVWRNEAQQEQFTRLISSFGVKGSRLDYVAAWFLKAGQYIQTNRRIHIAFVATNSITQGEQVAQLWPILFDRCGLEITFAHRTFEWGSEARGKAHVHVVIVGLCHRDDEPTEKRLFSYPNIKKDPVETRHKALTAYLFDAGNVINRHLVVNRMSQPPVGTPRICVGTKPVDGGHLIFNASERAAFLSVEPGAAKAMRPFIGGYEFINGEDRWILHTADLSPNELRAMPEVKKQINAVREYRATSDGKLARALADTPTSYHVTVIPDAPFLVLPEVSSERREYIPIGWEQPPTIPSNKLLVIEHAELWHFAILTSRAHMAWIANVGGRLKSDYQYSPGLVYNTFPWPVAKAGQRVKVENLAQTVLDARTVHSAASLADLYDPDTMPADLRRAHAALDAAVDRLYRQMPFMSDRDRVEYLFGMYEQQIDGLLAARKAKRSRSTKVASA